MILKPLSSTVTNIIVPMINVFILCYYFKFFAQHRFTTSNMQFSKAGTHMLLHTCYYNSGGCFLVFKIKIYFLPWPDFFLRRQTDCTVKLRHVGSETIPCSSLWIVAQELIWINTIISFILYFDLYISRIFLPCFLCCS